MEDDTREELTPGRIEELEARDREVFEEALGREVDRQRHTSTALHALHELARRRRPDSANPLVDLVLDRAGDELGVARFLLHAKVELAHPKPGDLVVINGPAEVSPELAEAIAEEMGLLCEQYGLGPSGWILLTAGLSLEVLTPDALLAAGLVRVPVESNAGRAEGVSVPRGTVAGHAVSGPLVEDVKP